MKNNIKRGFTLVELLAVMAILGILAVTIVPKIQKTIKKSKRNAYEASVQALVREAYIYYTDEKIKLLSFNGCEYNFTTGINKCEGFEFSGEKPEIGTLNIDKNGNISMAIKFEDNCYIKYKYKNNIIVKEYNEDTCMADATIPATVTSGDGLYESSTEPGRLIYRGQNPNNYIALKEDGTNNTLYRIVSYETDGTIKVVRDEKLSTDMAWDTANTRNSTNNTYCASPSDGCNVWGKGANTLYNGTPLGDNFHYMYYNSAAATTMLNVGSGTVISNSTLNTYLNDTWLPTSLTNYIDNHSWNVGGIFYFFATMNDKGIIKEKEEEKQLQWIGKVGLLNITEYAESSTNQDCTSVFVGVNESHCKIENYNYKLSYSQWSLSPNTFARFGMFYMKSTGNFASYNANLTYGVRPSFYLKASLSISGSGTELDPYQIIE